MPDTRQGKSNAVSRSSSASPDDFVEAMWRLKVEDKEDGSADAHLNPYPDRPGAPDCIYYLKTGLCGYGSYCKYNHPNHINQGNGYMDELPERVGQPDCQYFLKTGTCRFGASCKYHHPRDKKDARPVLNILGLPMRQDEKSCPYYMRNGSCKFGIACKFNHPQPATVGAVYPISGLSAYGSTGSSLVPSASLPLAGGVSAWSLSRPPYMSNPHLQGPPSYMPVVLPPSQGTMPVQHGWSTYMSTLGHVSSTDVLGPNQTSITKQHAQSGLNSLVHFPERPDQPECQYYMRTGSCKYGTSCKYHHPKERNNSLANCTLGPLGLPLRPGEAVCTFYSTYGSCMYGSACKFDHPIMGFYNYMLPALPIPDPSSGFPQQRNSHAMWTSAETSPSKALKLSDQPVKSDSSNEQQSSDSIDHGASPEQTSSTHIAPHNATRDSPKDHSN